MGRQDLFRRVRKLKATDSRTLVVFGDINDPEEEMLRRHQASGRTIFDGDVLILMRTNIQDIIERGEP